MRDKKKRFNAWFKEHKDEIKAESVRCIYYTLGFALGYFTSRKIHAFAIDAGIRALHDEGHLKFFNPTNGHEISIAEHLDLLNQRGK